MKKVLRGVFLDPREILSRTSLAQGDTVADFGCAAGYFTFPASRFVGQDGMVYAYDILPEALQAIQSQATLFGIANITAIRANLEDEKATGLDDNSVELVILKDLLFQNEQKDAIAKEARRILKPGGQALVVEWQNSIRTSIGPDQKRRVAPDVLERLFSKRGFTTLDRINAGDYHYALILEKKDLRRKKK